MSSTRPNSAIRRRLLATAMTGVVAMQIAAPAFAQSSIDVDLLNANYTRLSTATAVVDNYQNDTATNVTANAQPSGGGSIDITLDLIGSGNDSIDGSWDLSANQISANAYSNTATNGVSASTAPAFADSSAVSNLQVNSSVVGAFASGATVAIDVYANNGVREVSGASLLIDSNSISASANGNTSTNTIEIASGVSVAGTAGFAGTDVSSLDRNGSGAGAIQDVAVDADLAIVNAQINEGDVLGPNIIINADAMSNRISIDVEETDGSTLTIVDNSISSTAKANTATSSLSTGGAAATVDASMALANLQASDNVSVFADTQYNDVVIDTSNGGSGSTTQSSITIDATTLAATAFGNDSVQTLSIEANDISSNTSAAATIVGGSGGFDLLAVDGRATVTNMQIGVSSDIEADVFGNDVWIETGVNNVSGTTDFENTITLSNTTFDAVAVSNRSTSQAVSLTGNLVGTGVAVASSQFADSSSSTTADSIDNWAWIESNAGSGAVDSSLSVEGTMDRALAIGNLATTTIAVDGNDVTAAATTSEAVDYINVPNYGEFADVTASYASLNDQFGSGSVSADLASGGVSINLNGDDTRDSTISVVGNDALAAAIGSDATNRIGLDLNNVDAGGGFAALAAAVTQQSAADNTVEARALPETYITTNNDIWGSSVSLDGNSVEALATGNRSVLSTSVTANSIDTGTNSGGTFVELDGDTYGPNASILGQGIQSVSGSTITASLTDVLVDPARSAEIDIRAGEDIGTSDVSTDLNVLRASVTGNTGTNTVTVAGGSTLETSVGAANNQEVDESDLTVVIGVEGSELVAYSAFYVAGTNSGGTFTSVPGAALTLDAAQIAWLQSIYGADISINGGTGTITVTNAAATAALAGPGGTVGGNDQLGGHYVRADGYIEFSTLSVAGNLTEGSVMGNTATNMVSVESAQIVEATGYSEATTDDDYEVLASNMAQNTQQFFDTEANASVFGSFAIDTNTDYRVQESTLTIDGNTQLASATANEGSTTLMVSGTGVSATTGLQNAQDVRSNEIGDDISALSDAWIYSPMQMTDGTLDITSNVSQATSEGNVATNTVSVSATDLAPAASTAGALLDGDASGSVVLGNDQDYYADSMVAGASLRVFNEHETDGSSLGVYGSSINLTSNASSAESVANSASNALSIDAGNSTLASAALNSEQWGSGGSITTTADAQIVVRLTEDQVATFAVNNSSVDVSGNTVMALSTVNEISNTVDISATNVSGSDTLADADTGGTTATFLLSNEQDASADATSTVTANEVGVELNDLALSGNGVTGSSVAVDGNVFTAQTIGNRAANALNGDVTNTANASYAINGHQDNAGDMTSNVTSTMLGVSIDGQSTAVDSTISVDGNRSLANAIGNLQSNALVLNASSFDASGPATTNSTNLYVEATAAVRNDQTNTGAITSLSDNVTYTVLLNSEDSAMSADSVSLSGNSINARSVGNSATSSLLISGLASDTGSFAIQSYQSNQSDVIASVRNADITGATTGTLANSMASISGNSIGATATANTAVNRISR